MVVLLFDGWTVMLPGRMPRGRRYPGEFGRFPDRRDGGKHRPVTVYTTGLSAGKHGRNRRDGAARHRFAPDDGDFRQNGACAGSDQLAGIHSDDL